MTSSTRSRQGTPLPAGTGDPVRDSMPAFAPFVSLPLTMLTGRPHLGQRPVRFTPTSHLLNAFGSLCTGVLVSCAALAGGRWYLLLLIPGWAMTLHGMRNLRMMLFHQSAHNNMWGRPRLDAALGRVLSALLMIQHFDRYRAEHVVDHHARNHMTLRDPTVQAILLTLKLNPGMTRRQMWRSILGKILSPVFHARFTLARFRSYFHFASLTERLVVGIVVVAGSVLVTLLHGWLYVTVAWVLPVTLFYQASNTLRLCVKHTFPPAGTTERRGRNYFASLTNAIFLGEAAPGPGLSRPRRMWAWTRWVLRMLLVHFPARYLVLTGDTVCHDFHHRYPMSRDWANYIFAREHDNASGHPNWPPYRHVWGLVPAINTVLDSLANADPVEYDPGRLGTVNVRELFTAFDD